MAFTIRMGIPGMAELWNCLKDEITIIGLEPHPEDAKDGAYDRIPLSDLN